MIADGAFQIRPKDWTSEEAVGGPVMTAEVREFYRDVMKLLLDRRIPFLIGGAYAFSAYTGIVRYTKDLDLFVKPSDCEAVLEAAAAAGYRTELTFRHWLAKIHNDSEDLIDIIYSSGNGICEVDDDWIRHAVPATVLDLPAKLIPVEEMIWSKGYILERNRYDGADVAHLFRAQGLRLNWPRLLSRFGSHWRLLFSHMVLFGFVYPGETDRIPKTVMEELISRLERETASPATRDKACRGTLLSHTHYRKDVEEWGYRDVRRAPEGGMTDEDIRQWSAAFR
jgi:hypothetical protein